jgi:UTP--glucose-1-phosphate uridylyltransferase
MKITKAVITAAGPDHKHLPLQTLVSSSGETKTVLALLIDEALAAGIESVGIVIAPGTEHDYQNAAGIHLDAVTFIEQPQPQGFGHAILCAKDYLGDDPFLLLVGDHLYLSQSDKGCMAQLLDVANKEKCSVSAVQPTRENQLPYYGAVGGERIAHASGLYEIHCIVEKPTPTEAEQRLIIPGLRAGRYLCFFGMHALTSSVFDELEKSLTTNPDNLPLTPSLSAIAKNERYLAAEIDGRRFNIGEDYGLLKANLGMALAGADRDEIMAGIIELIGTTR